MMVARRSVQHTQQRVAPTVKQPLVRSLAPSEPRVLVVRPDHHGDVLLTLPALALLRTALPRARIHYLVPSGTEALPIRCRFIETTLTLPFPPLTA